MSSASTLRPVGGFVHVAMSGSSSRSRVVVTMPGAVSPGQIALVRIPRGPSSTASIFVSMCTHRFETEYAAISVSPHTAASEPSSTIAEPGPRCGSAACTYSSGATRLVSNRASQSSSLVSASDPDSSTPAFGIRMSSPPSVATASSTEALIAAGSRASAGVKMAPVSASRRPPGRRFAP